MIDKNKIKVGLGMLGLTAAIAAGGISLKNKTVVNDNSASIEYAYDDNVDKDADFIIPVYAEDQEEIGNYGVTVPKGFFLVQTDPKQVGMIGINERDDYTFYSLGIKENMEEDNVDFTKFVGVNDKYKESENIFRIKDEYKDELSAKMEEFLNEYYGKTARR